MKCKVCGAYNEDYLEYCESCAAPLTPDEEPEQTQPQAEEQEQDYQSYVAATGETPPAWGFVKAPQWPKPEFDANTVSEEDIPQGYGKRFNPRPAYAKEPVKPAPAPVEDAFFNNNVRVRNTNAEVQNAPVQNAQAFEGPSPAIRQPVRPMRQGGQPRAGREPAMQEPVAAYGDAPAVAPAPQRARPAKAQPVMDDFSGGARRKTRGGKSGGNKKNMLFIGSAAGLVVVIVALFLVLVFTRHGGSFAKFFSCTFAGDPVTRDPVVESGTTDDGDSATLITVYAKKNHVVRFEAGDVVKERAVKKQSIVLRVPETVWIPDEPLTESEVRITPNITIISPSGEETKLEFAEEIVIPIPSIEMTVNQPTVADFTVDNPVVPIEGVVNDNTVSVFVGENQVAIDEEGKFSTTYTLPAEGAYTLTVEARKNGCRSATATYNVTYGAATTNPTDPTTPTVPQGNVAMELNSDVKRTGTSATMTVSGTMESGAGISVRGVQLKRARKHDSAAGTFSFTVKTPEVNVYEAVITATKEGAAKTTTVYLEHQPEKTAYMEGVHRISDGGYDRIKNYPTHEQGYKVSGTVTEVYQSTPYAKARIKTSEGDFVFFYYSGVSEVAVGDGKTYELYADPYGTDEATGLPQIHAWFILKRSN